MTLETEATISRYLQKTMPSRPNERLFNIKSIFKKMVGGNNLNVEEQNESEEFMKDGCILDEFGFNNFTLGEHGNATQALNGSKPINEQNRKDRSHESACATQTHKM